MISKPDGTEGFVQARQVLEKNYPESEGEQ